MKLSLDMEILSSISDAVQENAVKIDSILSGIKVCDPAVGSGAFPVGMMSEIVRARIAMNPYLCEKGGAICRNRTPYDFKFKCIGNSLYGVDIDPSAVEIAKLRLWLSLIVDENDIRKIKPLPNLDYKIMQGNSLLEEYDGVKLFDEKLVPKEGNVQLLEDLQNKQKELQRRYIQLHQEKKLTPTKKAKLDDDLKKLSRQIKNFYKSVESDNEVEKVTLFDEQNERIRKWDSLRERHKKFFESSRKEEKRGLKEEIENLEWEFIRVSLEEQGKVSKLKKLDEFKKANTRPFFLWKLHFFEVFQEKNGFDIVIGNPPYVRADSGEEHLEMRQQIAQCGQYETLWEKWDLYIAFIEKGYKLLKPKGITTMIVSDAYGHSKYAQKSQEWFLKNARILRLDFCSDLKLFEAAVHNLIYFFQKADGANCRPERRVHNVVFGQVSLLPTDEQPKLTYRAFVPELNTTNFSTVVTPLSCICYISYGLAASSDEKLYKGEFVTEDVVQNFQDATHSKCYIEGKNIRQWFTPNHRFLEWGTERAPHKFRRQTFTELHEAPEKLMTIVVTAGNPPVMFDNLKRFTTHTSCIFVPWYYLSGVQNNSLKKAARYRGEKPRPDLPCREDLEAASRRFTVKYLLGVMNSSAARDFLRAHRRSNIHLYPDDWKKLPIPDVGHEEQAPIIALVESILAAKKNNPNANVSALEKEIDSLVNKLYGLDDKKTVAERKDAA